jgi:hypothetical protein
MRLPALLLLGALLPVAAHAEVTRDNFLMRTTGDLLALCSVRGDDPNAVAAIHFCHGYALGLRHYGDATGRVFRGALYCPPSGPGMTRDEAVRSFVGWAATNTQYMSEPPFDGLLRWAMTTWPCQR